MVEVNAKVNKGLFSGAYMKETWHVYYGTRGCAGLYIHALQEASRLAGIRAKSYVSCYYKAKTDGVVKCFFPLTDALQSRNLFVKVIRAFELILAYIYILTAAIFCRPRISLSLTDDTIVTYLFFHFCQLVGLDIDLACHDVITHHGNLPERRRVMLMKTDRIVVHNLAAVNSLLMIDPFLVEKTVQYPFPWDSDANVTSAAGKKEASARLKRLTAGKKFISFLGIVRKSKGIENLLDAWQRVSPTTDYLLLIAGKWSEPCLDLKVRAQALPGCIIEDRYLTDDELSTYLEKSEFVALPYLNYTHSSVMLMCADHGAAVIISDIPTFTEFLPDYQLYCQLGDTESLAAVIAVALTMSEAEKNQCSNIMKSLFVDYRLNLVEGVKAAYS